MYLVRKYDVSIEIENCIEFAINLEYNMLMHLRDSYNGICYGGQLILHVISVNRYGKIVVNHPTMPTTGIISVTFTALVVDFKSGDIMACIYVNTLKDHGRIVMHAKHAAAMVVSSHGDENELALLRAKSMTMITVNASLANPGAQNIAINASLYHPEPISYYYPIMSETIAELRNSREYTAQLYAPLSIVLREFTHAIKDPSQIEYSKLSAIEGMTVKQAFDDARTYFAKVSSEYTGKQEILKTTIVPTMFRPFREKPTLPDGIQHHDIDTLHDIPRDTTAFVVCGEYNPLDCKIGTTNIPLGQIPETWKRGALAQPAGCAFAKIIEHYLNIIASALILMHELSDATILTASSPLIQLWNVRGTSK
jgi:hypothetical protein